MCQIVLEIKQNRINKNPNLPLYRSIFTADTHTQYRNHIELQKSKNDCKQNLRFLTVIIFIVQILR